jgi:Helix-turn-helix domain
MVDSTCGWIAVERWAYREMVASEHGPNNSLMRFVLLVLSLHMHKDGEGAFPSQARIATRAGLSERTVRDRLKLAEQQYWLLRSHRGKNGHGWNLYTYTAIIPVDLAAFVPKGKTALNDDRHAAPVADRQPAGTGPRPAPGAATTGMPRPYDRRAVPTNSSNNSSCNSSSERPLSRTPETFGDSEKEEKNAKIRMILSQPENRKRLGTSYVAIRQLPESLRYRGYETFVEQVWEESARDGLH